MQSQKLWKITVRAVLMVWGGYGGAYGMSSRANRAYVAEQPSRFSKDYTIKPQKSYTRNGITYYN